MNSKVLTVSMEMAPNFYEVTCTKGPQMARMRFGEVSCLNLSEIFSQPRVSHLRARAPSKTIK